MPDLTGQSLGRYHILEPLGEGGMAVVYKAYDTRLESEVAVKFIRTENILPVVLESTLKRFEREAKSLARLTHPNIVKVMDFGEHQGQPYLVMPFLPGRTLRQRMGRPTPWQEAVRLLVPVARALQFAHEQGLVHRDVKPANILLTLSGEPMLTDFGIAKILEDTGATSGLTGTGLAIGTPEYMSPEQFQGRGIDGRTDIYSLGVVLYEMLTARRPYEADTPAAILIKQATDPLPRPRSLVPGLPQEVENVLLKALAKKPEDRYADMRLMAEALEGLLTGRLAAPEPVRKPGTQAAAPDTLATFDQARVAPPPPAEPEPQVKKRGIGAMLGWGFVVVLVLVALVWVFSGLPAREAPAAQAASPTPDNSSVREADGMRMVFVPAGEFLMGDDQIDDEKPAHQVRLDAFRIDRTEVTNGMYALCFRAGICRQPEPGTPYQVEDRFSMYRYENYPVAYVSWEAANAYCAWAGARLPTEAEWEKAARGTDGRTYPWGEGIDCTLANFMGINDACIRDTTVVGSYPKGASPYGALDMSGNVAEWVSDWYGPSYYIVSSQSNPGGPPSGTQRVYKGGAWSDSLMGARASGRAGFDPAGTSDGIGFRCAR